MACRRFIYRSCMYLTLQNLTRATAMVSYNQGFRPSLQNYHRVLTKESYWSWYCPQEGFSFFIGPMAYDYLCNWAYMTDPNLPKSAQDPFLLYLKCTLLLITKQQINKTRYATLTTNAKQMSIQEKSWKSHTNILIWCDPGWCHKGEDW